MNLHTAEMTQFRGLAAEGYLFAPGRQYMDIACTSPDMTRIMSAPRKRDCNKFVKLGMCLALPPKVARSQQALTPTVQDAAGGDLLPEGAYSREATCGSSGARPDVALCSAQAEVNATVKASHEVLFSASLWTVGEATRRCMCYRTPAQTSELIRRRGLDNVRCLKSSWFWAQGKEAPRELQYHTVEGSKNIADLFVKTLDRDIIKRDSEPLGGESKEGTTQSQSQSTVCKIM